MSSLSDKAVEQAKGLAPWSDDLPWWGIMLEGLLAIAAGLFVLLNPNESARNAGMFGIAALGIWGLMQFWWVWRRKFNESIDQWAAARGGIAIYAALLFYLLFFYNALAINVGLVILGLAGVIWGILGLPMLIRAGEGGRMGILLDSIIFALVGVSALYVLFQGPAVISTVSTIITWVLLIGGAILALMAFLRRRDVAAKEAQMQAAAKAVPTASAAAAAQTGKASQAGQPAASSASNAAAATSAATGSAQSASRSVQDMTPEELDQALDNLKRTTPKDPSA